ncbi:glycosyltransferase family 8 protein [Paraclostridium bifermentans]|uniref:glycosyltransferase family 8 protein n=1 Tax=Paraclostridium bifermentans TaxID=1490 RepID=UPI0018A0A19B|nr:glycosyltransferase family 8 protein [Paraclostridium bifermentans]
MNIVYTFDEAFVEITGVSLISVLENNKDVSEINVYVVDCGISIKGRQIIADIVNKYKRNIFFYKAINLDECIPTKIECLCWSSVCYQRLFFAEILPKSLNKVIHIDCDTIVRRNLKEIYNENIKEYFGAACYDCTPKPKRQAFLPEDTPYFSNGIIVVNLEKWRSENISNKFVEYIVSKGGKLAHLDQDVINAVLYNKIKKLPAEYNLMPITLMYKKLCCSLFNDTEHYYTESEIEFAVKNPAVIHFTGCMYTRRPWDQPCNHWFNDEWIKYYNKTEYSKSKQLLQSKKRKFIAIKQIYSKSWLIGCKIAIIKRILFWLDRKFLYHI